MVRAIFGDAVRWVLGEQSAKQLRGGKMEDVIFAGTELRKPVSYASVAITIDNSDHALPIDFAQVTIHKKGFSFRGERIPYEWLSMQAQGYQ